MLIHKSTPATKTGRMSATALGMLLCASAHITPAACTEVADALPAGAPLYGYFREARDGAFAAAQRTANFDQIRHGTDDPAHVSFDGEAAPLAGLTAGASASVRGQARALVAQSRPAAGSALEQRRGHRGVEVDAGEKIDNCGSDLDRWAIGKAGRADQAGDRLDRQIHCQIVAIRPAEAITRAGGIHETRIDLAQLRPADAEPVHCPGREILEQHIGAPGHLEQHGPAAFVLQIQRDAAFVEIEKRE